METKPGYKTSEFWITLIANVAMVLAVTGVVPKELGEAVQDKTPEIATSVFALFTNLMYIWSRAKIKEIK